MNAIINLLVLLFMSLFFATSTVTAQQTVNKPDKVKDRLDKAERKYNREFCSGDNYSEGDHVSAKELKEFTIGARELLEVNAKPNGGVTVKGSNRNDILVRACIQAWGNSESAARDRIGRITVKTDGVIRADGTEDSGNWNSSVSFEILVPTKTNLKLTSTNGGISVGGVDGTMDFETTNGGIAIFDAAGTVRGHTSNGGITVKLTGSGWKGSGLDLQTENGGVYLSVPQNFAADIESSTVNGGFSSNFSGLTVEKGRWTGGRAYGRVNGGGAKVRVVTTNGGVSINSF